MPNEAYIDKSPNRIITDLADAHDIPLPPERVGELAHLATEAKRGQTGDSHLFLQHGLKLDLGYEHSTARLDFTPEGHMSAPEDPAKRTLFKWYFIRAMENYMLLVESGLLAEPCSVAATTNERMANFILRYLGGKTGSRSGLIRVEVEYEQVRDSLLSPKMREKERSLAASLGRGAIRVTS